MLNLVYALPESIKGKDMAKNFYYYFRGSFLKNYKEQNLSMHV